MRPVTLPRIDEYAEEHSTPDEPRLRALAEETYATLAVPQMLSGPVQGRFLQMLVHALRPRTVVEIGTFSGYAALSMAAVLPPGGRVITCEIDQGHADVARRHIAASPYGDRVTVEVGPALDTLRRLEGPFDLVFVDADKPHRLRQHPVER
jgi:caffeoyl-CoA O-methyltransferase